MLIIGLVGQAGAGKDTVAESLRRLIPCSAVFAIADPLRDICKILYGLSDQHFTDRVKKETVIPAWGLSPRQMMQKLGTDFVRKSLGPDHWLQLLSKRLHSCKADCIIVSDVRFLNEGSFIKSFPDSLLIRITRSQFTRAMLSQHVSETEGEGINCDSTIHNNGSLSQLQEKVKTGFTRWMDGRSRILRNLKTINTDNLQFGDGAF